MICWSKSLSRNLNLASVKFLPYLSTPVVCLDSFSHTLPNWNVKLKIIIGGLAIDVWSLKMQVIMPLLEAEMENCVGSTWTSRLNLTKSIGKRESIHIVLCCIFFKHKTIITLLYSRCHPKDITNVAYHRSYPLLASCSDDCTSYVFHGMVYSDLNQNPLIVPLKILRGHSTFDGRGTHLFIL